MNVDYIMEYPLQYSGLFKTRINVQFDEVKMCFYYNVVNMIIDMLANFGMYGEKRYDFFCKSDNM